MDLSTKDGSSVIKKTASEQSIFKTEKFTRERGKAIIEMVKVQISLQMEMCTKEIGKLIKKKVKEHSSLQAEKNTRARGKTIKETVEAQISL